MHITLVSRPPFKQETSKSSVLLHKQEKKIYEIGFLLKPLEFSRYMLLEKTSVSSYSQTKTALKKMRNK